MSADLAGDTGRFAFDPGQQDQIKAIIAKYPEGRQASAVLPLLTLAQKQCGGWLPQPALDHIADLLGMPVIRVYEVASFYDMFNTRPVGRIQVRVCTTTPCWLCGSDDVLRACRDVLGIGVGESSEDGRFFLREFECLGACANAPMMWIDDDYYEDLDYDRTKKVLEALARGEQPAPGPQGERRLSMPAGGKTTLHEVRVAGDRPSNGSGAGKPDQEPIDKARPDDDVQEQAEAVERKGRPADQEGELVAGAPEDEALTKPRRRRANPTADAASGPETGPESGDEGDNKHAG